MRTRNQTLAVLFGIANALYAWGVASAQDAKPEPVELNEQEQAFVELLSGSALVGQFTVDGRENQNTKPERYGISRVIKTGDDNWIMEARITYGDTDVPLPVPVKVNWAGDTPVLSVTNLELPLIGGNFTSRVMFYGDRYAGTWQHNQIGGHMFGTIEKADASKEEDGAK
jgi:hypothetical protein